MCFKWYRDRVMKKLLCEHVPPERKPTTVLDPDRARVNAMLAYFEAQVAVAGLVLPAHKPKKDSP